MTASQPFDVTRKTLAAGNTRLQVSPDPYALPRTATSASTPPPAGRRRCATSRGNAFNAPATSFWYLAGDANRDKRVDMSDFSALRTNFGKRNVGFAGGDFDFDGVVGNNDFAILRRQFGKSLGPAPAGFDVPSVPGTPPATPTAPPNRPFLRPALPTPSAEKFVGRSPFGEARVRASSTTRLGTDAEDTGSLIAELR